MLGINKYPYDRKKITLTKGNSKKDFWLRGNVKNHQGYTFEAKVFDKGSKYGIDGGRISKLTVYNNGVEFLNYCRGWEKSDDPAHNCDKNKKIIKDITSAFPEPTKLQTKIMNAKVRVDNFKDTLREKGKKRKAKTIVEIQGSSVASETSQPLPSPMQFFMSDKEKREAIEAAKKPLNERVSELKSSKRREPDKDRGR